MQPATLRFEINKIFCVHSAWEMPAQLTADHRVKSRLEMVASFCYLGDMLSAGGGCEITVTTRMKTAWKKFRELLPVLTSRNLSYKTPGHVMLHASETWPLTKTNLQGLQHMIGL